MRLTVRHISTTAEGKQIRSACVEPGSGCAGIVQGLGGESTRDRATNTAAAKQPLARLRARRHKRV